MNVSMSDCESGVTHNITPPQNRGKKRTYNNTSDSLTSLITNFSLQPKSEEARPIVVKRIRIEMQEEKTATPSLQRVARLPPTLQQQALELAKKITSADDDHNIQELLWFLVQNYEVFKNNTEFFRSLEPVLPLLLGVK